MNDKDRGGKRANKQGREVKFFLYKEPGQRDKEPKASEFERNGSVVVKSMGVVKIPT